MKKSKEYYVGFIDGLKTARQIAGKNIEKAQNKLRTMRLEK